LWESYAFQQMARELGYILQPTAPDAAFQNGVVERPNRTLGDMMRTLLHSTNLGPEYWSWALIHAVYLKNRLPHRALGQTPFQAYTGYKPNLKKLRLFGCPVVARLPGKRPEKLDTHAAMGIFLGYTGTDNNIYYQDHLTKCIKISTHVTFDEAGYTLPKAALFNTQIRLQSIQPSVQSEHTSEYTDDEQAPLNNTVGDDVLQVKRLSHNATMPTKAYEQAAGYDIHSAIHTSIPPHSTLKIPTDIAVTPPTGTYCQLQSRSGILTKHNIEVKGRTVDQDYTCNIYVILRNTSDSAYNVTQGDAIAQLVINKIATPTIQEVSHLTLQCVPTKVLDPATIYLTVPYN